MFATTITSLFDLIATYLFSPQRQLLIGGICLLLFILTMIVVVDTVIKWPQRSPHRRNQCRMMISVRVAKPRCGRMGV